MMTKEHNVQPYSQAKGMAKCQPSWNRPNTQANQHPCSRTNDQLDVEQLVQHIRLVHQVAPKTAVVAGKKEGMIHLQGE